jgi:ribosomal protein S18 acetylase RimI-like enzyme
MEQVRDNTEGRRFTKITPFWRTLSVADIESLISVAARIHPGLPESDEVFLERITLFPRGCLGLTDGADELCGYIISHPIRYRQPPALDHLLREIVADADQYYIHDLAILPEYRGSGLAHACINMVLSDVAKHFATTSLVSVYGTSPFWSRYNLEPPASMDETLKAKLVGYGNDAMYLERKN